MIHHARKKACRAGAWAFVHVFLTHHSRHCPSTGGVGPDTAAPATAGGGETVANSSGASANNAGRSSFVGVDYGTSGDLEAVHSATGHVQTWRPENVPLAHPSLLFGDVAVQAKNGRSM